jgi:cytochrome c biogenesis protein CcdA
MDVLDSMKDLFGPFTVGLAWALGLGIYTSITPCPLATNIAAISYIGRRVANPRQVLLTGLLYALGRTLAYTVLGFLLVAGLAASSAVSSFFRQYMNDLLGPILILVSMFLLGMLEFGINVPGMGEGLQKRVDALGIWGAFFLGIVFALSFCPISAGLFFLTLIPYAVVLDSHIGLPAVYGIGTALPVVVFAFIIAFSAQSLGKVFNRLTQFEIWIRRTTGAIFLAVGIYFTLRNVFELPTFIIFDFSK